MEKIVGIENALLLSLGEAWELLEQDRKEKGL